MNFAQYYADLVRQLLERELTPLDGLSAQGIAASEARLGYALPLALREYYRVAGNLDEVNRKHNYLLSPEELEIRGEYLIFMAENQAVVLWGVKLTDLAADPTVWGGVEWPPRIWNSENQTVSEFLRAIFVWVFELYAEGTDL